MLITRSTDCHLRKKSRQYFNKVLSIKRILLKRYNIQRTNARNGRDAWINRSDEQIRTDTCLHQIVCLLSKSWHICTVKKHHACLQYKFLFDFDSQREITVPSPMKDVNAARIITYYTGLCELRMLVELVITSFKLKILFINFLTL